MKTTMNKMALLFLAVLVISCTNDSDNETPEEFKPSYLLIQSNSSSGFNTYTYDDANKLIEIEGTDGSFISNFNSTVTYNANGKIQEELKIVSAIFSTPSYTRIIYNYDAQGKLIEKKYTQNSSETPAIYDHKHSVVFEYNGNTVTQKLILKGNALPSTKTVFEYDKKGNVSKITYYNEINANTPDGLFFYSSTYTYDTKPNPETSLPLEYRFPNTSKNNPIKVIETNNSGSPTTSDVVVEYNEGGYPVKESRSGLVNTYEYKKL
jgi:YD repeat-containing protein